MQIIEPQPAQEANPLDQAMSQQFDLMAGLVEIDREIAALEQRVLDLKSAQRLRITDIANQGQRIGQLIQEQKGG